LDVASIVASGRDDEGVLVVTVIETDLRNVLGMACHSDALLVVLQAGEPEYHNRAQIITSHDMSSVSICINGINVCAVHALSEDSVDLPSELAS